jgi:tRNA(fMet)-specific endonuclease VapC
MLVLDSDHITALQFTGPSADRLLTRLDSAGDTYATTIVTVEESLHGWINKVRSATTSQQRILYYEKLNIMVAFFQGWVRLPFDESAAAKYEELRTLKLRSIGSRDLQIASIVLRHNATLLSANLQHFRLVPGLNVEDWLHT